jgi:spore maturation protein CgeB
LLGVHPGASYATHDVYAGLVHALREQGFTIHDYNLDARIERAGSWLRHCWRRAGRPDPKPTTADILYRAGVEALERALRFDVDGVLVVSAMYLHPDLLILMRRAGLRTAVVFTESPYDDLMQSRVAQLADVCWTNERSSVPVLRVANPQTYYLPSAYDPARHRPDADADVEVPENDVVFIGSCFDERIQLLSAVDWSGIDLGIYGSWESLPSRSRLRRYLRGNVVSNDVSAMLYRRARIGLNLYRRSVGFGRGAPQIAHAESLNPRAYELAACGVFQLSDYRAEVAEQFGDLVPTFDGASQLGELVRFYLDRPSDRAEKAAAARQAVASHTFAARAAQLAAQLQTRWSAPPIARGA